MKRGTIRFVDIFDFEEIQRMQDLFSDATGIASLITNPDGTPITNPSNFCRMCALVRSTKKGLENCIKSDQNACNKAHVSKEISIKPCLSAGLWDAGTRIVVDGKHIANWLIGQVANEEINKEMILDYADEIGLDKNEFFQAYQEVPKMSIERFRKVAEMLSVFVNEMSNKAYKNQQLKLEISKREKANELLHKSEEALSITLKSIGDGVISTDKNGLVVNMNPVAEKLCGWSLNNARGLPLTEVFNIVNSENCTSIEDLTNEIVDKKVIVGSANHFILRSKNGSENYITESAAPIKNKDGAFSGIVLVFSDVTETYLANEKIRQSELRYRGLMNTLDAGVVVHAPDSSIITCNPKAIDLLELSEKQLKGLVDRNKKWIFYNEQSLLIKEEDYPVNTIIRSKKPIVNLVLGLNRLLTNDILWVVLNGFPVIDRTGKITEVVISFIDITQKRNAQEEFKKNENFLRETQFIAKLGSFSYDALKDNWVCSDIQNSILGIDDSYKKTHKSWKVITHPDWLREVTDYFEWKIKEKRTLFDIKYKIIRQNDGQLRWVHALGQLFYDENGQLINAIGTLQDITERKKAKEALKESQEQLKNFAAHLQNVREEERILLAREIHDELGQILIALKIDMGMLKQNVKKSYGSSIPEDIQNKFDGVFALVDSTIETTRRIMTDLRPEVLYLVGFVEAVKLQLASFQDRFGIACSFNNSGKDMELNTRQTVALFRILQESLTNIAQHSGANSVEVRFEKTSDKLVFQICDNGIGFDVNQKVKPDSYGLIGMKERVFLLDGELSIESIVGSGTTIKVEMSVSLLMKDKL